MSVFFFFLIAWFAVSLIPSVKHNYEKTTIVRKLELRISMVMQFYTSSFGSLLW